MERNVELFHDIAEMIEKHPEKHAQDTFCGTACCIGGWAMLLSGEYELDVHPRASTCEYGWLAFIDHDGNAFEGGDVSEMARLLGLDLREAEFIYSKMSPPMNYTWSEALYKIAAGADVHSTLYE